MITIPAGHQPSPELAELVDEFNQLDRDAQQRVADTITRPNIHPWWCITDHPAQPRDNAIHHGPQVRAVDLGALGGPDHDWGLTAQLVHHDAEPGFPALTEVAASFAGNWVDLNAEQARQVAAQITAFAQQLQQLADHLDQEAGR